MSDMGKYTSSSFFLLTKLPRPSGSFILLPSLLHRPSQAPPPQNLPVKRAILTYILRQRPQNTHKLVLQLVVAAGDPSVRGYCLAPTVSDTLKNLLGRLKMQFG